ncbi:MAG: YigZ family protein [Rhizobiaceae bacterium]|nr:YigZ family protein [Rhizobiaceae bacterium]
MPARYTLQGTESFVQEIKKSRFLAMAAPIDGEAAAKAFIAARSNLEATHNCWAWRLGQAYRFSDDGEPGGTAGKPILQAIDGQDLDNVVVLVTRWFGGTLLGSGGLVRAYGGTAAACLRAAPKQEIVALVTAHLACPFADLALVKARLRAQPGLRIAAEDFTATGADLTVEIPEADAVGVSRLVADITAGRVAMRLPQ